MHLKTRPSITVTPYEQLRRESHIERLRMSMRNLGIPRRKWPDVIADALYTYRGLILLPNGYPWQFREVDEVVNERTIGYFLQIRPGRPDLMPRVLEPLRYYDTTIKIRWPYIARHFSR